MSGKRYSRVFPCETSGDKAVLILPLLVLSCEHRNTKVSQRSVRGQSEVSRRYSVDVRDFRLPSREGVVTYGRDYNFMQIDRL